MLAGRDIALSPWLPLAYFWQDVLVALVFGACARICAATSADLDLLRASGRLRGIQRPNLAGTVVAVVRPMWRAARGPMADSFAAGFTPRNIAVLAAMAAGDVWRRPGCRRRARLAVARPRRMAIAAALRLDHRRRGGERPHRHARITSECDWRAACRRRCLCAASAAAGRLARADTVRPRPRRGPARRPRRRAPARTSS